MLALRYSAILAPDSVFSCCWLLPNFLFRAISYPTQPVYTHSHASFSV